MHKERFYIILFLIMGITVVALVAAFVASERQRPENVVVLRSRTIEIEAHYRQRYPLPSPVVQEEALKSDTQKEESTPDSPTDTLAAFERFSEMMAAVTTRRGSRMSNIEGITGHSVMYNVAGEESIVRLLLKRWNTLSDAEQKEIKAFIDNNQELILELRRLAKLGGPIHELDFSSWPERIDLPHLFHLRNGACLLAANIIFSAEAGNYDEVTKDAIAITEIADTLGGEPILISQLIRVAMYQRLYESVAQNLRPEDIPTELFAQIISHAPCNNEREALADALMIDASWYFSMRFDGIREGTNRSSNPLFVNLYGSIGRPLLNRDEEIYVDFMERTSNAMRLPYYQAKPALEQIRNEAENLSYIHLISRPSLSVMIHGQTNNIETLAQHEAHMGLMQVGLAVEHYHGQHGVYPDSLEQIAPLLGGTLPLDPYTGQSFVYKPGGNAFQLYSARGSVVGANKRPRPSFYDAQGNIVWRYAEE